LDDVANAIQSQPIQPLDGYISVAEIRRRFGVSRSMVYRLSKRFTWQRILTPERDLYFLESQVLAVLSEQSGTGNNRTPEPEEVIVQQAPAGYRCAETISRQYHVDCVTIYQAADRHYWGRARSGNRVYFNDEDVQAYFEPEQARGYSLVEAAAYLGISPEQAALAARLNGWRRLLGKRFRASDVERHGAAQAVEAYLTLEEASARLALRRARLVKHWQEREWRIEYLRIGKIKAIFVRREHVEQFALENDSDRQVAEYYTTQDIRHFLKVSRQRVGQLAELYAWRRFYPSSRHVLYLRADVDVYLNQRQGRSE
jgi:hypothetical protein